MIVTYQKCVASTRMNRYEKAVHLPDIDTAQRLADRLQVPLPYLFAGDDQLAKVILEFGRGSYKPIEADSSDGPRH